MMNRRNFLRRAIAGAAAVVTGGLAASTAKPAAAKAAAAISIPCAKLPLNTYIKGPRYHIVFDKIVLPRFKNALAPPSYPSLCSEKPRLGATTELNK